jgi:hypothetical protein
MLTYADVSGHHAEEDEAKIEEGRLAKELAKQKEVEDDTAWRMLTYADVC